MDKAQEGNKSNYDDFYIPSKEEAAQQIHTAKEMEIMEEKYL